MTKTPHILFKVAVGIFVIAILGLAIACIEVELLPENHISKQVEGKILSCKFKNLIRSNDFFLGITLKSKEIPYLRINDCHKNKKYYMGLCQKKATIKVKYQARKLLASSITYWIEKIEEK
jgi:hypothetical protein